MINWENGVNAFNHANFLFFWRMGEFSMIKMA